MRTAITREVSPGIARCELTHVPRTPIDLQRARAQHTAYVACLAGLGCRVLTLPAAPELPDSVFVEDAAVVLDELAVLTRPGAESRRGEVAAVAAALRPYRRLASIVAPATVDGGDVLHVGRRLFVGLSSRSNVAAVEQMRALLEPYGYTVLGVPVAGCLHLKSAVTQVADGLLLVNRDWVDGNAFPGLKLVEVHPAEPFAANALLVGQALVYPAAFPRTRARLEAHGLAVHTVDVSELAKAEGAVTCCSLIFDAPE